MRHWCRRCGQTNLLFLPAEFQRRLNNTTKLDREAATVFWKVRIVFPHVIGEEEKKEDGGSRRNVDLDQ